MSLTFTLTLIIFIASLSGTNNEKEKWLVERSSTLTIEGESNISDFTCEISGKRKPDTLTIDYDLDGGDIRFVKKRIVIDISAFDCGNPMITRDFKLTLKTDEYSVITLDFLSLKRPTFKDFSMNTISGDVLLTIAGVSRNFTIDYTIKPNTDGTIDLSGCTNLNIREFNLSPPVKLMGLVKVKEDIEVAFNMHLTPIL